MKWDIQAIMTRADRVIEIKHTMGLAFPQMPEEEIDRLAFAAGFQDAFTEGQNSTSAMHNLTKPDKGGWSQLEMKAFGKFAKDYKSPPDINRAFTAFLDNKEEIMKKYKP